MAKMTKHSLIYCRNGTVQLQIQLMEQPVKVVRWCPGGDFLVTLRPVFAASPVQHVSDLHLKFALRPHLGPLIPVSRYTE